MHELSCFQCKKRQNWCDFLTFPLVKYFWLALEMWKYFRDKWFVPWFNIGWDRQRPTHTFEESFLPAFRRTITGWWENTRGFNFFFLPLLCFASFSPCAGSDYVEITRAQGQGGRDLQPIYMRDEWEEGQEGWRSGRGAPDRDCDLLRVHTPVLICVCVCVWLREVCDLLAFVMEMDPAGPTR